MHLMKLDELHKSLTKEIESERRDEMAAFIEARTRDGEEAERRSGRAREALEEMGLDLAAFDRFHQEADEKGSEEVEELRARYIEDKDARSRIDPGYYRKVALDTAIAAPGVTTLQPSYAAIFSTSQEDYDLAGGSGTVVYNYNCYDYWAWAKGGGNGWFGSGAGSYQVWAEWGYWFYPETNKYYSIIPHNVFRGFYILRADDGFWTSKEAKVKVSIWNNVWQYNWKGWTSTYALNEQGDNINVNKRFDTDRHTYYAALLGGGDWAYVRNVVGLNVYARGSGSYAELNFATGAANYLCAPHLHVY